MEESYQTCCRFCLKESAHMVDVFTFTLPPEEKRGVDFITKITDIKLMVSEYLPNQICGNCADCVKVAFKFSIMCKSSDNILKKQETRREFRKIEEEALEDLDEQEEEHLLNIPHSDETNEDEELFENATDDIPIKHEETVLNINSHNGLDNVSDASDEENTYIMEIGVENAKELQKQNDTEKQVIQFQEKYICSVCSTSFSNKMKFLTHQKTHDETKSFKCTECFQSFLKDIHLKVHLRCHVKNDAKKFICKTCGQQFIYEYLLKQHEYKHSDEKPFPCPECGKGCLTSGSLNRHVQIHSKDYNKKTHICTICWKKFPYPSSLLEHMKHHTGEKPYLCPTCGKGFRQVGTLHCHQKIHLGDKPFKCDVCQESFLFKSRLKVHIRKHTNERPYICDMCGMSFRHSTDLKSHTRTHTGNKSVACPVCGKRMSATGQLTIHLRSHTGEKPYSCKECSRSFTTRTILVKHERIHTGEKPYICDVCGKAFTQSSTLKNHSRTHASKLSGILKSKLVKKESISDLQKTVAGVEKTDDLEKNEFMVILPAPIPLITT